MATMLWEMIRYKNFDTESPYNREAAIWAKAQTDFRFPIDPRSIRDRVTSDARNSNSDAQPTPAPDPVRPVEREFVVPAVRPTIVPPSEVQVTRVPDQVVEPVQILETTSDGIEIINAEVAPNPTPPDDPDAGIFYIG